MATSAESAHAGVNLLYSLHWCWQADLLGPAPAGKLLAAFTGPWHIKIERLSPTPDMAGAALQPVLVSVQRANLAHADDLAPVELSFVEDPSAPNAEQLQEICQACDRALACMQCSSSLIRVCQKTANVIVFTFPLNR